MSDNDSKIERVQPVAFTANYAWSVGKLMEKFIKSLADKKILASKCPGCGYVYTPPRNRCGKCQTAISESDLIELSGKGVLTSYTSAYVDLDGAGNFVDLESPRLIGAIKLEGADSTVFMPLGDVKEDTLEPGLELEVAWNEQTKGEIPDIKCFRPAK